MAVPLPAALFILADDRVVPMLNVPVPSLNALIQQSGTGIMTCAERMHHPHMQVVRREVPDGGENDDHKRERAYAAPPITPASVDSASSRASPVDSSETKMSAAEVLLEHLCHGLTTVDSAADYSKDAAECRQPMRASPLGHYPSLQQARLRIGVVATSYAGCDGEKPGVGGECIVECQRKKRPACDDSSVTANKEAPSGEGTCMKSVDHVHICERVTVQFSHMHLAERLFQASQRLVNGSGGSDHSQRCDIVFFHVKPEREFTKVHALRTLDALAALLLTHASVGMQPRENPVGSTIVGAIFTCTLPSALDHHRRGQIEAHSVAFNTKDVTIDGAIRVMEDELCAFLPRQSCFHREPVAGMASSMAACKVRMSARGGILATACEANYFHFPFAMFMANGMRRDDVSDATALLHWSRASSHGGCHGMICALDWLTVLAFKLGKLPKYGS